MSAIVVENLSKRYVIGHQTQADTLRDALSGGVRSLWTRLRRQRQTREEFYALRDVSFTVEPGEVVGIIGRNGAGKSTLLKILSRITEPTTGRIALNGRVASLLEVGTGFHPELSGRENIFLNGAILGMSRAEIRKKFDEIVAFAEVEKFLDTPVKRYSSGMYVRLAFAVAAHLEPEILIVDEVLAVGDGAFQQKCMGKMQQVARTGGRTILFVSHNTAAIEQICPRAFLFESGRLILDGACQDTVSRYLYKGSLSAQNKKVPGKPSIVSAFVQFDPASAWCKGYIEVLWPAAGPLAIEAVIHDSRRHPVALAQVGSLDRQKTLSCPAGIHRFDFSFDASSLADGPYWIVWQIMRPREPVLDRLEMTSSMQVCQALTTSTRAFEQNWQSGSVLLKARANLQSIEPSTER